MIGAMGRVLAALAGLAAAGAAALCAFAASTSSRDPAAALEVWADYAPARLARLEERRAAGETISELIPEVGAILDRAPLMDAPLVYRTLEALGQGDEAGAFRLARATLARSPRNLPARLLLTEEARRGGDGRAALIHLDRLMALDGARSDVYLDLIVALASEAGGADAFTERLALEPFWADGAVRRLNAAGGDMDRLLVYNTLTPSARPDLIARLLEGRGVEAAFIAWLSFLPPEEAPSFSWPYDGTFEARPGLTPFNWTLYAPRAELMPGGGLYVSFIGRGRSLLAEQTMLLRPGAYRLSAMLSGEGRQSAGALGIALECRTGGEIAALALTDLTQDPRARALDFIIPPEGCPAQRLILRGEPGEYPQRIRAEVSSIVIEPVSEGPAGTVEAPPAGGQTVAGRPGDRP